MAETVMASSSLLKDTSQPLFEEQVLALADAASPHNNFTEQVTARSYASAASLLDFADEQIHAVDHKDSQPESNITSELKSFALTLWTILGSDTDVLINILLDIDLGSSYRSEMEGYEASYQYENLRKTVRPIYDQLSVFYLDMMKAIKTNTWQPEDVLDYMTTSASSMQNDLLPEIQKLKALTQYRGNKDVMDNTIDSISAFVDTIELFFNPLLIPIPVTEVFNTICQTLFSHGFANHEVQTEIQFLEPSDVSFDGPQDQLALLYLILLAPFKEEPLSDHDDTYPYGTHHLTPTISVNLDEMLFNFKLTDDRELRTTELLPPNRYTLGVGYELARQMALKLGGDIEILKADSGNPNGFSLSLPLFPDEAHVRRPLSSLFRAA
jgi:hypothetical protein